ncbi:MAG: helix-turn-helix domain-containing protein [Candidatus Woesearchaeota archaeon]
MWYAKLLIPANDGMLVASRAKKHKIALFGYPLSFQEKNNKFLLLCTGHVVGASANKKAFLSDLKKDKRTMKIDMVNDHFGFWLLDQHPSTKMFYDPLIIYVKPFYISPQGDQILELASWDKRKLMAIARAIQTPLYGGKLLSMTQKKINHIAIMTTFPELTDKQKRAFDLAVEHGYYGYPRKISMQKLAKIMKTSYATYEFHLRNAEKKLMPYLHSTIN